MLLCHGTTRMWANDLRNGPNAQREPGSQLPGDGFNSPAKGPFGFGSPRDYAKRKAKLYRGEGGPAILEFELPDDLANDLVPSIEEPDLRGRALNHGDEVTFDIGHGIEQLLQAWPDLKKRIILLAGRKT